MSGHVTSRQCEAGSRHCCLRRVCAPNCERFNEKKNQLLHSTEYGQRTHDLLFLARNFSNAEIIGEEGGVSETASNAHEQTPCTASRAHVPDAKHPAVFTSSSATARRSAPPGPCSATMTGLCPLALGAMTWIASFVELAARSSNGRFLSRAITW